MSNRTILAATAVLALATADATAGELPSYDFAGLPITSHQMSVLGVSGATQEQPSVPSPLLEGIPVSPAQIAILGRRPATPAQSARPFWAAETQIGITIRAR